MSVLHPVTAHLLRTFVVVGSALMSMPVLAQPTSAPERRSRADEPGLTKAQVKALKKERKQENREGRNRPPVAAPSESPTPSPATNPSPLAEDFDWNVNWEQKDNHDAHVK